MRRPGHYVEVRPGWSYKMAETWIDTDNEVWAEPYHLYGVTPHVNENWRTISLGLPVLARVTPQIEPV